MLSLIALKAAAIWIIILVMAFANAALRELLLIPRLGQTQGLALSGVLLSSLVFLVVWISLPWVGARYTTDLLAIGAGWLVLTIVFDLVLGWLQHKPVQQLFDAYLFKGGNLWPIVVLVTMVSPYLVAKLRDWA